MTAKTTKPRCLMLDANIIIVACKLDVWQTIIDNCEVYVPSIVVHEEALFYFKKGSTSKHYIDLPRLVSEKKVIEVVASAEELSALNIVFEDLFLQQIHAGEAEALALLVAEKLPTTCLYCTGDAPPIKALAMLGKQERGISFESLLKGVGRIRKLRTQYTEQFFQEMLKRGSMNFITRAGLSNKSSG